MVWGPSWGGRWGGDKKGARSNGQALWKSMLWDRHGLVKCTAVRCGSKKLMHQTVNLSLMMCNQLAWIARCSRIWMTDTRRSCSLPWKLFEPQFPVLKGCKIIKMSQICHFNSPAVLRPKRDPIFSESHIFSQCILFVYNIYSLPFAKSPPGGFTRKQKIQSQCLCVLCNKKTKTSTCIWTQDNR